jgi:membrane-associated phospholipid phosphatase
MAATDTQALWLTISWLGAPVTMAAIAMLLCAALLWRREPRAALACALITGLGGLANVWLKSLVHRSRPPGAELILHAQSWSFPSGHAMGSLIGYGLLCWCAQRYWRIQPRTRAIAILLTTLLVFAIGVSRVALGVHYPGDVFGGWVIGALWLAAGIALLQRSQRGLPSPRRE